MIPIPEVKLVDVAFGNSKHLPKWDDIPESFRSYHSERHCEFVSHWFFKGLIAEDLARLAPKDDIDRVKALAAISAILKSFKPQHEHKIAACGYLLSEWFTLSV